ncbi:MAG: SemiSWEET transporter [Deltaproteobacteria bacterium]|nr:SemiSWEET transporter [Deltaproteobacteria bacterium]MCL4874127.1 SemiSWEET transporter [bacterium]
MDSITFLGLLGGTLTTASFFPQVVKTIKTRSTKDVSFAMFLLLSIGITIWIIYGIKIGSIPVVIANSVSLVFSLIILILKLVYK